MDPPGAGHGFRGRVEGAAAGADVLDRERPLIGPGEHRGAGGAGTNAEGGVRARPEASARPERTGPDADAEVAGRVGELLQLLAKCDRAYQIYASNNPVYQRFVSALHEAFERIWDDLAELRLTVHEHALSWGERSYVLGEGREDLAFRFYKDGVRYLTFLPGFEDELERFLDVVRRARRTAVEEDDLVTLLWEQDFEAFRYGYVDLLADGLSLPSADELELPISISMESLREEVEAFAAAPTGATAAQGAPGLISRDDFSETLYFLDPSELDRLHAELDEEWARDLKDEVLNALFDRFEDPDAERQSEIVSILRQLLAGFLGRGDLSSAAVILREMEIALEEHPALGPDQRAEVLHLFDELGDPVVIEQLLDALEDGEIAADSKDLGLFFEHLPETALRPMIRAGARMGTDPVRGRIRSAVDRLALRHSERLPQLLRDKDVDVVVGTAGVIERHRLNAWVPQLSALLRHASARVRLAAVDAMIALRSADAIAALERALGDDDRDVRLAAVRGLGSLRFPTVRERFEDIIESRAFRSVDLTERLAVLEAYALIAGADAVPRLDQILNGRGFLGRRPNTDQRACAATALGKVDSPAAREALEKSRDDPDPVVRGAVSRSLRREQVST